MISQDTIARTQEQPNSLMKLLEKKTAELATPPTSLNFATQFLSDEEVPDLLKMLSNYQEIEFLDLSYNDISNEGAMLLATNLSVKHLNLSHNHLGDEAIHALVKNPTIISLSLAYNSLGNASCGALATKPELTQLNLEGNHISDLGLKQLVKNQPNLSELKIGFNPISSKSLNSLMKLKKLHTLDLTGLDVPSPTAKRLLANMNLKDLIY